MRPHLMKWLNVKERLNAAPVLGHSGRSWKAIAVTHGPLQRAAPAPSCGWWVDDVHDDVIPILHTSGQFIGTVARSSKNFSASSVGATLVGSCFIPGPLWGAPCRVDQRT
ncbi:unnamed protein product [Boreogadus saida]